MIKIKRFVCNTLQENAYVVSSGSTCIIIDPGFEPAPDSTAQNSKEVPTGKRSDEHFFCEEDLSPAGTCSSANSGTGELKALYEYLNHEGLKPEAILLTHKHLDHILGLEALVKKYGIPVYPEQLAEAGAAPMGFRIIRTPGHTPDSVCYYNEAEHALFTGDTLFAGTIGRTDLPGGDYDSEIRSIMEKLIFLPGETDIYPGHGPASTIARERMENPFLEPFNEREELDL